MPQQMLKIARTTITQISRSSIFFPLHKTTINAEKITSGRYLKIQQQKAVKNKSSSASLGGQKITFNGCFVIRLVRLTLYVKIGKQCYM